MIIHRPRRLRRTSMLRDLVRETNLSRNDLIYPLFVVEGSGIMEPIKSMEGQYRYSVDMLTNEVELIKAAEIKSILLFGIPNENEKDEVATSSHKQNNIVVKAIKQLRLLYPSLVIMTDVCVCAYTRHGHCGIMNDSDVDNDKSIEILAEMAYSHAIAGADVVAPSAMMDGQVAAIRAKLDENGYESVAILAYSAKYYSSAYGPFREAAGSAPQHGDRAGYQMDIANGNEAIREVNLDLEEGADMVMVKPALFYMDIIYRVKEISPVPVVAYNVSGEYAMIKSAAAAGLINEEAAMMEMLTSMKRAGASLIITYFAKQAANLLRN